MIPVAPIFEVGVLDPPWDFKVYNRDSGLGRSAASHYRVMTLEEVCALPVGKLFAQNAVLFLWIPECRIFDAREVFDTWEFTFKTVGFNWTKLSRGTRDGDLDRLLAAHRELVRFKRRTSERVDRFLAEAMDLGPIKYHMGMGYHTRANPEVCLLATRGKGLPTVDRGVREWIVSPVRRHSQKPERVFADIERLYGPRTRLEGFARARRPNWATWGDEVDSDIVLRDGEWFWKNGG